MALRTGLALAAATTCVLGCADESTTPSPNIVLIVADDLGYGHLGCYGQRHIRTPHVDALAAEGTRFTQFYAGAPVCAPSRSVLLTGRHAGRTSVRVNGGGVALLADDVTMAEVLKRGGYATGAFGKWGLGDAGSAGVPNRQGFDEFFGQLNQTHAHFHYPAFLWRNEQRVELADNWNGQRRRYAHDLVVDEAMDFIRRHRDRPFFLYLALALPHFELLVPADSAAEYEGRFPEPFPYSDTKQHYADQPRPRATLAAMITRLDRDVGRLVRLLDELGIEDDTILVFTSDNGGLPLDREDFFKANGALRGQKGTLYEGGIRVPMIVRWKWRVRAGAVDDVVWASQDLLPTLAELAGIELAAGSGGNAVSAVGREGMTSGASDQMASASYAARLLGRTHPLPPRVFYWNVCGSYDGGAPWGQALRMGEWKAVVPRPGAPLQLFDLAADSGETRDVAGAHPEVVARVASYLATAATPSRVYWPEPPTWDWPARQTGFMR